MQTFLKRAGLYDGELDGQFGRTCWTALQKYLDQKGCDPGDADGIPGPRTRRALRALQKALGVPETGEVDAATVARLLDSN